AGDGRPREQAGKGWVAGVEAAGVGAEGRQDQPLAVGEEAATAHAAAVAGHAGAGMQVPGDLARRRAGRRFVTEGQAADDDLLGALARQGARPLAIMVADDPDQGARGGDRDEARSVPRSEPGGGAGVMEAVAE